MLKVTRADGRIDAAVVKEAISFPCFMTFMTHDL